MEKFILYGCTNDVRRERVINKIGGEDRVLYTVDSFSSNWDESKCIYPPERIKQNPESTIICLSPSVGAISSYLRNKGINNRIVCYPIWDSFFYADEDIDYRDNVNWINKNEKKIRSIYQVDDKETARILDISIKERKKGSFEFIEQQLVDQFDYVPYFSDRMLCPEGCVTFLDGGGVRGRYH